MRAILLGFIFGIILIKSEVISWFRIYDMFHFRSFYMFGIIGVAVIVAAIMNLIIKKRKLKTFDNKNIERVDKELNKGSILGGTMFGIGWAICGACPGPIYAQIGLGNWQYLIVFAAALFGVLLYGLLEKRLR
jgi:uncharacterized protein